MRTIPGGPVVGGTGRRPMGATDPTRGYANQDGPGNTTNDYGPHRGGFSFNGLSSPRWDDRNPSFDYTPEKLQAEADYYKPSNDRINAALNGNDAYTSARSSGDMKGMISAMTAMKAANQKQNFMDQGGQGATWDNRFSNENNFPRPTSSIGYSHGPGRPDYATRGTNPSPYGPGNTAPPMQGGGAPPAASTGMAETQGGGPTPVAPYQGPMGGGMPGGRYGGPGVTSGPGGWGSAGGYNPGASLQGPSSLGMGGSMSPQMQQMLIASEQARGFGGGSPFGGGFGGGMPGGRYGGPGQMGGGPVQGGAFMPGLFGGGMSPGRFFGNGGGMDGNPFMMGRGPGGSLGGMSAFGYNPGAQFNPFMMY